MKRIYEVANIHTSTMDGYLLCTPLLPGISSLASYFPLKSLAIETSLPLGISNDLPWCGYGYFLDLCIGQRC